MKTKPRKKELKSMAAILGRRGGLKNAKRGKEYMTKLAKKGANARWSNHKKLPE